MPLCYVYRTAQFFHKHYQLYRQKPLPSHPTIIAVGNIIVGGVGKTPTIIYLANQFKHQGQSVAIICRNYGASKAVSYPIKVEADTSVLTCGDEARLIFDQTQAVVVSGQKKYQAYEWILQHQDVDVILIDDGLQHYRIPRHLEILITDERFLGNQHCLPVGPMREGIQRLQKVNWILKRQQNLHITDNFEAIYELKSGQTLSQPIHRNQNICLITAIANPSRLIQSIEKWLGFTIKTLCLPDHDSFSDIQWSQLISFQLLMTEKDAVKCKDIQQPIWVIPQIVSIDNDILTKIIACTKKT